MEYFFAGFLVTLGFVVGVLVVILVVGLLIMADSFVSHQVKRWRK